MALSVSGYNSLLLTKLQSQSFNGHFFNGARLPEFTLAVATGVVNTALTVTGQVTSPSNIGMSSGVGITVSDAAIAAQIRSECIAAFGQEGPVLQQFCQAIGEATAEHFANATLSSDTNGPATFALFATVNNAMASAIQSAASFNGTFWPAFCTAIANGICDNSANGTGTLSGASGDGVGPGIVIIS